ncbi:MAG: response regulator [Spirochaetes bacterium]|nr:response regulator [Spirochaetota bacterium]
MKRPRILIVEDDAIIAEDLKECITELGYETISTESSAENALSLINAEKPDLILMDIKLCGILDGIEATAIINARHNIPVIYITAFSDAQIKARVSKTKSVKFITKPFNENEVKKIIRETLEI